MHIRREETFYSSMVSYIWVSLSIQAHHLYPKSIIPEICGALGRHHTRSTTGSQLPPGLLAVGLLIVGAVLGLLLLLLLLPPLLLLTVLPVNGAKAAGRARLSLQMPLGVKRANCLMSVAISDAIQVSKCTTGSRAEPPRAVMGLRFGHGDCAQEREWRRGLDNSLTAG
jgi:hypothetical protein